MGNARRSHDSPKKRRKGLFWLTRLASTSLSFVAFAAIAHATPTPPPLGQTPRRSLPDYRGRPAPTKASEIFLWAPRVAFFPVYLVTEYALRRPLGVLVSTAERGQWIEKLTELFTFGPRNTIGVVPTALLDFGLRSSVGVYFFWDDFLFEDNQLRAHAAFGGTDFLRFTLADRIPLHETTRSFLKLRFEASMRPDQLYYGIGPRTLSGSRSRYGAQSLDGSMSFHLEPTRGVVIDGTTGFKTVRFDAFASCCDDDALGAQAARHKRPLPPGTAGYTALRQGLRLTLDSRKPRPLPGSGVRFETDFEYAIDVRDPVRSRFIRYGGEVGAYLDLTGHNRVLGLSIAARFADPLGEGAVPFTELVAIGGDRYMYGFWPQRVLGRSAAIAMLEYRYPIWAFLDGTVQASIGNAFGRQLEGIRHDLMRMSFDFGLRSSESRDHPFNILVGFGTETFADGAKPDSLRLMFGGTHGF